MNKRWERDIEAWLEAESRGADDRAEEALGRVFRQLERPRPSASFAHAVLMAAGFGPAPLRPAAAWLRLTLVGCAVSACLFIIASPWLLVGASAAVHLAAWPLFVAAWRGVTRSASFFLACGAVARDLATALRLSLATPTGAAVVLVNLLVAAVSLLGLKRLLANSRSLSNAS